MKTPDYVLEAQFKTMLRKARLFDWLQERVEHLEVKGSKGATVVFSPEEDENFTLYDLCDYEIRRDPDFQWLKD